MGSDPITPPLFAYSSSSSVVQEGTPRLEAKPQITPESEYGPDAPRRGEHDGRYEE